MHRTAPGPIGGGALRLFATVVVVGLLVGTGACGRKSESEQASEWLAKGLDAHRAGHLAEAASDYRQVLVHDPNNKYAYFNLGVIDQTNGALASAESNYGLALSTDRNFVPALFNLATVETSLGKLDESINLYRRTIKVQPDYAEAHMNLGFALIDAGERREGRRELALAVQLKPELAERVEPAGSPKPAVSSSPTGSPSS
jgi:tetratricopeptide (TPR) repeat protein